MQSKSVNEIITYGDLFHQINLKVNGEAYCPATVVAERETFKNVILLPLAAVMATVFPFFVFMIFVCFLFDAFSALQSIIGIAIYAIIGLISISLGVPSIEYDQAEFDNIRTQLKTIRTEARRMDIPHNLRKKILKKCRLNKSFMNGIYINEICKLQDKNVPFMKLRKKFESECSHI